MENYAFSNSYVKILPFPVCPNYALYSDRILGLRCIKLLLCFYYQAANELACAEYE